MGRKKGSKNKKLGSIQPFFKATFTTLGKTFNTEGTTALEAILNLKPDIYKSWGVLTIEKGEIKREKIIGRPLVYRLFGPVSNLQREIAIKQLSYFFDI